MPFDIGRIVYPEVCESNVANSAAPAAATSAKLAASRAGAERSCASTRRSSTEERDHRRTLAEAVEVRPQRDDEEPGPRLRHEMNGVDHQCAGDVAAASQGASPIAAKSRPRSTSGAAARFPAPDALGARLDGVQSVDNQPPKAPERARSHPFSPCPRPLARGPGRGMKPRRDRPVPAPP